MTKHTVTDRSAVSSATTKPITETSSFKTNNRITMCCRPMEAARTNAIKPTRQVQSSLLDSAPGIETGDAGTNIEPAGDLFIPRETNDGLFRIGSNNINGSQMTFRGLNVAKDIEVTDSYGFDMMGLQETKKPWTAANRQTYNVQCNIMWPNGGARNAFSSAPWEFDERDYQAGGTLLSLHGRNIGRLVRKGEDPLGRFEWMRLRGERDEGVLVINAYRVCQTATSNPDVYTQFHQERTGLRAKGIKNPDPRKQLLKDLLSLIDEHRLEGYRPILLWDANEDWVKRSHKHEGEQLVKFMQDAQLADPFYNKFGFAPRTYVRSQNRLDYILVDPALTHAIQRIGYLGNTEANGSDHAMAYVDFDEKLLFKGLINRPTEIHSREFMVEQDDKKLRFTTIVRTFFLNHNIPERVFKLAALFAESGATQQNLRT